jgi:prolipoprotein diacylglyceryltransferase
MHTLFTITTGHGGLYYSLFYMAAFLLAGGILIYRGFRSNYPGRAWLVVTLFGAMCFIIGNKLITMDPGDLPGLFRNGNWPETGRSILGGIMGLILGLIIARKWLKIRYPVLDHLAYALPLAMIVTRFGCLFAGCCFGKPTDLPWGIQYGAGSIPFQFHADHYNGLLQGNLSASVHPTQIYDMLSCALIIMLLWFTRKRWKAPESRFLFVVACYAGFRFIEEFFREAYSGSIFQESVAGLRATQWALLGAVMILGFVLYFRERKGRSATTEDIPILPPGPVREFILFASVLLFLSFAGDWLETYEKTILWVFLLPPLAVYLYDLYCHLTIPALRWTVPLIAVFSFVAMSQALVPDEFNWVTYKENSFGTMIGSYYKYVERLDEYGECGPGTSDEHERKYFFNTTAYGVSKHLIKDTYKSIGYGSNFYIGFQAKTRVSNSEGEGADFIFGINPYGSFKSKFFGIDGGIHLGYFKYAIIDKDISERNEGEYIHAPADLVIFPQMMLRFGTLDIFYLEAKLAGHFPSSSPMPLVEAGIATGLGRMDGRKIGFGITDVGYPESEESYDEGNNFIGIYGVAVIPLKKGYLLEASYADNFIGGAAGGRVFSIGFHHRFDYKYETPVPKKEKKKKDSSSLRSSE